MNGVGPALWPIVGTVFGVMMVALGASVAVAALQSRPSLWKWDLGIALVTFVFGVPIFAVSIAAI